MKVNKFRVSISVILVAILSLILIPSYNEDSTYVRRFCAYGQVYIEFEKNNKIWGTIFVDENNHPVRCEDEDVKTIKSKEPNYL